MARQEKDREDLLREATALVERIELVLPDSDEPLVIGFRRDASASVFVGADPVFQFNTSGELRRGYWNGKLIKAERGRLASLERVRNENQVQLVRREMPDDESAEFLDLARTCLDGIARNLQAGSYQIRGQVPAEADVVGRVQQFIEGIPRQIRIAGRPHAG